jgi:hypothetical protein
MEVSERELVTLLHGMLFGGFFLMALSGALILQLDRSQAAPAEPPLWQKLFLFKLVALAWLAVLTGAYIIYPWYRAVAPSGADLALYPKALLLSRSSTAGWHNLGMEWKEHVAWIAPMAATLVAYVMLKHRALWNADRQIRAVILAFAFVAFFAAAIAGGWGAVIDKKAPVEGGRSIHLMESAK